MSAFAEFEAEHVRLAILQFLQSDGDYEINAAVLQRALHSVGHGISTDALRTQCAWLAEQQLVTTRALGAMALVKLTTRGEDVALGRARAPGVARPRPGEIV